jgi:hypothetical protein
MSVLIWNDWGKQRQSISVWLFHPPGLSSQTQKRNKLCYETCLKTKSSLTLPINLPWNHVQIIHMILSCTKQKSANGCRQPQVSYKILWPSSEMTKLLLFTQIRLNCGLTRREGSAKRHFSLSG